MFVVYYILSNNLLFIKYMKFSFSTILLLLLVGNVYSQFIDAETPENAKPANDIISKEWKLDFSDEFNGTEVNTVKWNIDNSTKSRNARPNIGIYDWRWKPENVSVLNGNLILKVHKTGNNAMTNGSIQSHNKYSTQYGYFEARIKVGDAAKGTHTAFWLQGPNMGNVDGTANDGAEIDIFETAWTEDYTKSVVHIDGYGADHKANTKKYDTPGIHSGFHTWGFHWTEQFMDIYYDGVFKVRYSDPKWVVKSPEFLWLSNGASFGLSGDQYFIDLPLGYLTETQVDYIRVWKSLSETEIDPTLLKQDTWSLLSADSQDEENPHLAVDAFDNNPYTFWFTQWSGSQPAHPHEVQIDLGETADISGFKYLPRQDGKTNGNVIDYEFYGTNDLNNWGEALSMGKFNGDNTLKTIDLGQTVNCKYIKFVALSDVNSTPYTNVAELYIKGQYRNVGIRDNLVYVDIKVFPNPFQNQINVEWNNRADFNHYRIYSIDGTLINKDIITENQKLRITTRNMQPGGYLIELLGHKTKAVKRIVKI
ncbi:discoidin domain-containing protein [Saccharicrinis sp. GN24d3]|uniref:discoidin domain-containing protein n=1 Tax=Saccharicrinis sp. GN24d3 TaxID=3458416 RepID=UPI0040359AD9